METRTSHKLRWILAGPLAAIAALALIPCVAIAAPIMPTAPLSGYLFDETYSAAGNTVTDSFGTRNGTLVNATAGAADLPTSNSDTPFSYVGNQSILNANSDGDTRTGGVEWTGLTFANALSGSSAITIQAWVKYTTPGLRSGDDMNRVFLPAIQGNNNTFGMLTISGNATVRAQGRSQPSDTLQAFTTTGTLNASVWNQIVYVLDYANDQIRISLNGGAFETSGTLAFGSNTLIAQNPISGGTGDDTIARALNVFRGLIDEVAIWDHALTIEEVQWLNQNSLHSIPEPGSFSLAGLGFLFWWSACRRNRRRTTAK